MDFPKAEYLYASATPAVRARLRGHGFTLYGLLPDVEVDRDHVFLRARDGEFDLVVFGDMQTAFGVWVAWGPRLHKAGVRLAILDGGDPPGPYPYAGRWWRRPGWWFLPRAHNRSTYFKRELTPATRWFASYLMLPPRLGRSLGLLPTSFCIPSEHIVTSVPEKDQELASHIVDDEVAGRLGREGAYVFSDEREYYRDLQRSRFGITTKRAGWDALRHYEIAANGAVPCFRDLGRKPRSCAPHGLDATNSIAYRDADELFERIAAVDEDQYARLQAGALGWARANTTVTRAREILAACGLSAPA